MSKSSTLRILNIVTYLIMVGVNTLANTLPLFGRMTGEISDSLPNLFVPAGYVFAIWGLIYLLLGIFVIWQALPNQKENGLIDKISPFFIAGNLFNTAWVFAWHSLMFPLTEVFMLGLLVCLAFIYAKLDLRGGRFSGIERLTLWAPFSVYLGWISVATIANTAITLLDVGWGAFGITPETWTLIMLAVATLLASFITITRRELPYTLVILWALVGIALRQAEMPQIATTAWIATGVVAVVLAFSLITQARKAKAS